LVPWNDEKILKDNIIDMIFSTAVLEHVDDLDAAYRALSRWLKSSGYMVHQIDFKSHGITKEWNGYWKCSDFIWGLIRGKRAYLINRHPYSTHVELMNKYGFKIVFEKKIKQDSKIRKDQLTERFKNIPEDDLTTSGIFLQAVKE
jgi:ubiquinone/menaquinone biosynthesis C-methylase UbiE